MTSHRTLVTVIAFAATLAILHLTGHTRWAYAGSYNAGQVTSSEPVPMWGTDARCEYHHPGLNLTWDPDVVHDDGSPDGSCVTHPGLNAGQTVSVGDVPKWGTDARCDHDHGPGGFWDPNIVHPDGSPNGACVYYEVFGFGQTLGIGR